MLLVRPKRSLDSVRVRMRPADAHPDEFLQEPSHPLVAGFKSAIEQLGQRRAQRVNPNTRLLGASDAFKESEHPRAAKGTSKGGQFTSGGGGGATAKGEKKSPGALAEGQWVVQYAIGQILKKHGYKKIKSEGENRIFENAQGHQISIHPPPGGTGYSGHWTVHHITNPSMSQKGKGSELEGAIQKLHTQQPTPVEKPKKEPKKEESSEPPNGPATTPFNMVKEAGYKLTAHNPSTASQAESWVLSLGETHIQIFPNGQWTIDIAGQKTGGLSPSKLENHLNSIYDKGTLAPSSPPTPEPKIENPPEPKKDGVGLSVATHLVSQKYEFKAAQSSPGAYTTYVKDNNKITVVTSGPNDGVWDSVSPGHVAKKGKGLASLQALMAGKPKDEANGITWENTATSITPQPPGQKAEHEALHHEIQQGTVPPMSGQKGAVSSYKGSGYHHLNDCLRHQVNCNDPQVDKITEWLNNNELPKDVTVYRGVSSDYAKILRTIAIPGMKFREKGFLSTSTSSGFSKSWGGGQLFLTINAPKGSKAGTPTEGHDGEYEVVFQCNSVFEVVDFDEKSGHMTLNLISQEPVGSKAK